MRNVDPRATDYWSLPERLIVPLIPGAEGDSCDHSPYRKLAIAIMIEAISTLFRGFCAYAAGVRSSKNKPYNKKEAIKKSKGVPKRYKINRKRWEDMVYDAELVAAWIDGEELTHRNHPGFSFAQVCDIIGINTEKARRKLKSSPTQINSQGRGIKQGVEYLLKEIGATNFERE